MSELTEISAGVAALLKQRGEKVAVSESAAGGLISAALLAVPGASAYFLGGGVIYTRPARRELLRLPEANVTMDGGSEEYALICAREIRERLGADWGLGETGAAGPTGSRYGHAAGHACFAVAGAKELSATLETGSDDREANMWRFAKGALDLLEAALRQA